MKNTCYYIYPLDRFINKIVNDETFCMSRFNDGEWYCMRKEYRHNLEEHPCYDSSSNEMLKAITNPINIQAYKDEKYLFQASLFWKRWLDDYINWKLKIKFIKNDIVHELARNYPIKWMTLITILNTKNVIIVGPEHIKKYTKLKYKHFIDIPYRNCYLSKQDVIFKLCKKLNILGEYIKHKKTKNVSEEDAINNTQYVVLFCAGMLSNSVIDELFPIVKDKHTLLDFGSVFDIFINDSRIVRRAVVKDDKLQVIRDKYNHDWLYLD